MGQDTVRLDRALLLQQADWVKNLARNLVRDPMGADDVAQETMLAALASPPRDASDARHMRAWLGRVAFNLAHLSTRRSIRRRDREERVARREREDSTAEEVIRTSVLGQVVDAVSELPDPYRTAVRLHYFEGWATAEIARETGTSESAVRKRLWRARGRLRRSLDGCHNGERQAWFQALGPWLGGGAWVSSGHPGAGTAHAGVRAGQGMAGELATAKVAAAVLAAVGLSFGWQQLGSADPSAPANSESASRIASLEARSVEVGSRRVALASRGHSRTRSDTRTGTSGEAGSGPSLEIHVLDTEADAPDTRGVSGSAQPFVGRAVDPNGLAIGGVPIATSDQPEDVLAWTSGSGEFWIDASGVAEHAGAQLVIARNTALGWATLRHPVLTGEDAPRPGAIPGGDPSGSEQHWLIAAPAVDLAGTVLSAAGMGLEQVEVSVVLRDEALAGLPLRVTSAEFDVPHTKTGPFGGFRLANVPSGPGIDLVFERPGHAAISIPVPSFSDAAMLVQWTAEVLASRRIEGVVRDANGTPVGGARVALGEEVAWTDARGSFAIETNADADPDDLTASKHGFGGSYLAASVATSHGMGEIEVAHVELQLDGTQGTIEGRVESAEGEPLLGWFVYAAPDEDGSASGGSANRGQGHLGFEGGVPASMETAAAVAAEVVGEDGTFRLFVAADHAYQVSAVDPATGASSELRTVWGGSDRVLLVVRDGDASTRVRLVDEAGNPLRSLAVRAEQTGVGTQGRLVAMLFQGWSGADGSLPLPDPALSSTIQVQLPALGWSPPAGMGPSRGNGKTLFVPLPAGFLAEAGEWTGIAAMVAAEDENGRPVLLGAPSGARARVGFARGRSPLFTLPEGARTLLLLDASGEELLRSEVRREPGSIETVRLPRR